MESGPGSSWVPVKFLDGLSSLSSSASPTRALGTDSLVQLLVGSVSVPRRNDVITIPTPSEYSVLVGVLVPDDEVRLRDRLSTPGTPAEGLIVGSASPSHGVG